MRNIKMIGLDLDGTLLNENKELTFYTENVLKRAIAQGVQIVISTGRPFNGVPKELLELSGMRYVITSNGGRIIDLQTQEVLYDHPVPHDTAEKVLKIVSEYETLREVYFDGQGYVQREELENIDHFIKKKPVKEYVLRTRKPVDDIWRKMQEMYPKGADKVHALFANLEDVAEARKQLEHVSGITTSGSLGFNLEVNAAGVHKGAGLLILGNMLGIPGESIMACGDGGNDLEMIKTVGFGVAMANATEEVKSAADYITCSNEEDGVAKAIEKYVLKATDTV